MKRILHIVLVLVAVAACQGPRIIPKDTLTDIYEEMFIVDQQVRERNIPRVQMDTMLVYEAVFNKYGYDTDDYLNSVQYYLKDPERFAKVFEEVAKRLEREVSALDRIMDYEKELEEKRARNLPLLDSMLAPFSKDAVYLGLARVERDSSRYGAWFHLVPVQEDTLMIPVDSLKKKEDIEAVEEPVLDDEMEDSGNPFIIQESRSQVPVRVISTPRNITTDIKEEPVEEVEEAE